MADLNVGRDLTSQVFVPYVLMTKAFWELVSFSCAVEKLTSFFISESVQHSACVSELLPRQLNW